MFTDELIVDEQIYDLALKMPPPERDPIFLGDRAAIVGLFSQHYGAGRNVPVVRVGSIAAFPREPIKTKMYGDREAYLVEAHSIGGLSGSPVFVWFDPIRVHFEDGTPYRSRKNFWLLGLVHGHFDAPRDNIDLVADDEFAPGTINSGIAIVVPARLILETIDGPELCEFREKVLREVAARGVPFVGAAPK